jgi:hypothetical protein
MDMLTRRMVLILVSLSLATGLGLAKVADLPVPDPERGSLGVIIEAKPPSKMGTMDAVQVFFVRLDEGVDPLNAESFIPSNFFGKGQVYLLNAKPGRYVAVAVQLRVGGPAGTSPQFHAFLSKELIPSTQTEVVAGKMAFMGEYMLETSSKMDEADPAQSHYYQMILPETARKGFMKRAFSGEGAYTATLKSAAKDDETADTFWQTATKAFKAEPSWLAFITTQHGTPHE